MFEQNAEDGLNKILDAVRPHLPTAAMKPLQELIRSYGKLCGSAAVIEHLSKKLEAA